ncbi:MAG: extracellular solute-binding protein [Atopobiaceae bacterium]|jgi:ABC-type glycerol-3-phosphate transport system substrate-binding protein|nr:extracellular solute-binding protein [Atopobiaceae bacterium]
MSSGTLRRASRAPLAVALVVAACAALAAAALLVGCGSSGQGGSSDILYQKDSGSGKEITFFLTRGNEAILSVLNQAASDYESEKGVKVVFSTYNQEDDSMGGKTYDQVVSEQLESDSPGDIYVVNSGVLASEAEKGNLLSLDAVKDASSLSEDSIAGSTIKGKVYSIPLFLSAYCLYANNDLLKANGLEMPHTLDEFYNCCEVLKANGVTPFEGNKWWVEGLVLANGMTPLYRGNAASGIASLNDGTTPISTYVDKGFQVVEHMSQSGYMDLAGAYDIKTGADARDLVAGKCAFCISLGSTVDYAGVKEHPSAYSVTGIPTESGSVVLTMPDYRLAIAAKSKNAAEASDFVAYLSQSKYSDQFATLPGRFSMRSGAQGGSVEQLKEVYDCFSNGQTTPAQNYQINVEQWENTCNILWKMMQSGETADEAAAEFDQLQSSANAQGNG